jgi:tetratricopeptide (TPR) repeat protein
MPRKKEADPQLSEIDTNQVQDLISQYKQIADTLHASADKAQAEAAVATISALPEAAQILFLKTLAKTNDPAAADVVVAINALNPYKEVRKEAKRALIRFEGSKIYPTWPPPITATAAVQLTIPNPPRFWQGFVTQSREEGEQQIILFWEQGYEYGETRVISLLLDYWLDGVKDAFVETSTKRRVNERLSDLRSKAANSAIVPCSLAEGKRLLEEALSVNQWHGTTPHENFRSQLPLINKLILQTNDLDEDHGTTFITPELQEQEVVVNFIGAWSFGDYGLAYDLLTANCPLRDHLSRSAWINLHRAWFDEAHPARMELGFVHERERSQSALWVPTSVVSSRQAAKKEFEVGWSLELLDTPLSGTLKEIPMGTAIYKGTGRHWFWTSYTLVKDNGAWRIQQARDEGATIQGLSIAELQKRIKEYEDTIEQRIKQRDPNNPEAFVEEMSWRLTQLLHYSDALIALLPLDYTITEEAYSRAVLTGNSERMLVYLERLAQRFQQNRADVLRRLGSTMAEMAFRYVDQNMAERQAHFLARAVEILQEAATLDNSTLSHALLGELFMSQEHNEEAEGEFLKAQALLPTLQSDRGLEASVEAGLGNVAMRFKRIEDAIPHFQRVAAIDPHYTGVWFSLGFANRLLGYFEEAEKHYLQGLQVEPNDIRIYSELTAIYMNHSEQEKARTIMDQAVRINPDSAELHALFASVLFEIGDRRGAQRQLETAEQINPHADLVESVRQHISSSRRHS